MVLMTERQELRFNKFCYQSLQIYTLDLLYEQQCRGYKKLKELIESGESCVDQKEYQRWKDHPTLQEIESVPELKYLCFLHPNAAMVVRQQWDLIIDYINS